MGNCSWRGSIIDVTKLASFKMGIPFISFPTTASHDGIASANASIKGLNVKTSIKAKPPIAVIADIDVIKRPKKIPSRWSWRYRK